MNNQKWTKIKVHHELVNGRPIINLFEDKQRFDHFSVETNDILLDFSKTNIDREAKALLLELIDSSRLSQERKKMFSGGIINKSENRPALHWALRASEESIGINERKTYQSIRKVLRRTEKFANQIRVGKIKSATNQNFTDIINIGIGGSDLGPKMSTEALAPYHDGPRCHFISNVDSADLTDTLRQLQPETTLVIIASKTFTTLETMTNARAIIVWLKDKISTGFEKHLVAVSSNPEETTTYGIAPERLFDFPDSIGGRYSMWGPIGLPIMIAIGVNNFRKFLCGAREMDDHFLVEKPEKNLPILLAMVGLWHRNVCQYVTRAILPYEQRLSKLPAYLQQLDMESNGKQVSANGNYLDLDTVPIVWGEPGTNGQHAFYQMLHQGTTIVPCEFLIGASGHEPDLKYHHELLVANCLSQSEALMNGRTNTESSFIKNYRKFPGNRPSVTIAYSKLTPKVLGSLIALFEHRTFVEGIVWGVNSFDQWGVELGKELSNELLPLVQGTSDIEASNQSTAGLLAKLKK